MELLTVGAGVVVLFLVGGAIRSGRIGPAVIGISLMVGFFVALSWLSAHAGVSSGDPILPVFQTDNRANHPIQRHLYGTSAPSSMPSSVPNRQSSPPVDEQHGIGPQDQNPSSTANSQPSSSPTPTLAPVN